MSLICPVGRVVVITRQSEVTFPAPFIKFCLYWQIIYGWVLRHKLDPQWTQFHGFRSFSRSPWTRQTYIPSFFNKAYVLLLQQNTRVTRSMEATGLSCKNVPCTGLLIILSWSGIYMDKRICWVDSSETELVLVLTLYTVSSLTY